MYATAMRLTGDCGLAEDLVQESALRALRFRDRYQRGTNFKAWILTLETNLFRQRYRRDRRRSEILLEEDKRFLYDGCQSSSLRERSESPENYYLRSNLSDEVLRALNAVSDDYRLVVWLCDVEGLSYREIAEIVDRPVGTVMSRLHRGRKLLKDKLSINIKKTKSPDGAWKSGQVNGEQNIEKPHVINGGRS